MKLSDLRQLAIRYAPHAQRAGSCAWRWLVRLLLAYAVVFSLVGTVLLVWVASIALRPVLQVRELAAANPPQSAFMAQVRAGLHAKGEADSLQWSYVPLDSVSPNLINAVVAAEDDAFYTHPGFDVAAILAAVEYNRTQHNGVKRGASTITQQLAKNLFLSGERSFKRKYAELMYAVLMEIFLGKDRILELYLNYAQWGRDIFGCGAASRAYFGKPCAKLSIFEAARLAAILANPSQMQPGNMRSAFMGKRLFTIATNLYYKGYINDTAFTALCGAPPPGATDSTGLGRDSTGGKAEGR